MYAYVMCPKCKDQFLETDKYNFFDERHCPKCGNRYVLALLGEKSIDDTVYKITFDGSLFLDNKVIKYLEEKLEEYHFDVDDMMQKIKNWEEGMLFMKGIHFIHICLWIYWGFTSFATLLLLNFRISVPWHLILLCVLIVEVKQLKKRKKQMI